MPRTAHRPLLIPKWTDYCFFATKPTYVTRRRLVPGYRNARRQITRDFDLIESGRYCVLEALKVALDFFSTFEELSVYVRRPTRFHIRRVFSLLGLLEVQWVAVDVGRLFRRAFDFSGAIATTMRRGSDCFVV